MKSSVRVTIIVVAACALSLVHGRPNTDTTNTTTLFIPISSSSLDNSTLSTTTTTVSTSTSTTVTPPPTSDPVKGAESSVTTKITTTEEGGGEAEAENSTTSSVLLSVSSSSPSPDSAEGPIRKCAHGDDATLNKCLRQILQDLRPKFGVGIPELNIPPMDPLKISNIAFQHGSGPVKVIATFSNVDVRGLSSYNKSDFGVDTKRRVLDFDLGIATMQITGNYQLAGNLFFFPIGGSGSFWLNLGGISAKGQGKLGAVDVNNRKSIVVKKIEIDLDISTIKLHLTNLFNGDALLGNVINNFLNENAKDIFDEVRPQIGNQVAEMVSLLANRALSTLSADHFTDLPEDALDK